MKVHDIKQFLNTGFTFNPTSVPLPPELRLVWRLSLLMLVLNKSRSRTSSLNRLHVLNYACQSKRTQAQIIAALNSQFDPEEVVIRYEPALDFTIDFAIGENLVDVLNDSRIKLSAQGLAIADDLNHDKEIFLDEKYFLNSVALKVTEKFVKNMSKEVKDFA